MTEFYLKLDEYISKLSDKKDDVAILNFVLRELGEIPDEVVSYIVKKTGIWDVAIKNTINFYPKFKKKKNSDVIEVIYCNGRQCAEKNEDIINELKESIEFDKNGLSKDGKIKLTSKRCLGECASGPNIEINGLVYNRITLEKLKRAIKL